MIDLHVCVAGNTINVFFLKVIYLMYTLSICVVAGTLLCLMLYEPELGT